MDFITVTAKTVKDAILEASLQLETFRDNIEYEVIEEGSTGFFGIGSKKAVIKARKKVIVEDILKDDAPRKKEEKKEFKKEKKESKKEFKKEEKAAKASKEEKKEERKEEAPAVAVKEIKEEVTSNEEKEVKKERKVAVLTLEEQEEAKEKAEKFLKDVLSTMEMKVDVKADYADEVLNVELAGDDMGVLIGKRGQTLDSLQYLTSLVVNKGKSNYIRVKLDTEDYRKRRKETLENLARGIAYKVRKTRKPVILEPMNPYERRIIHSALQGNKFVETVSEGEEPYRHVVVKLKRN